MRISPTASWPEWQQCGWVEKQEEDRLTSSSGQWPDLCLCVCLFLCVCAEACACVHTAYVQTRYDMCSPGHCSTFSSNGGAGVTQIRVPVRKENLLFPGGEDELSALMQERDMTAPLADLMMGRPMDKGHKGNFTQA